MRPKTQQLIRGLKKARDVAITAGTTRHQLARHFKLRRRAIVVGGGMLGLRGRSKKHDPYEAKQQRTRIRKIG